MNESERVFQKRTGPFNRLFSKAIFFAAMTGMLIGPGVNIAKAAEVDDEFKPALNISDPYAVARHAWACRNSLFPTTGEADVFNAIVINPWNSKRNIQPDYKTWSNLLSGAAAWSVLYGHSLWSLDTDPVPEARDYLGLPGIDPAFRKGCKADLDALPTLLVTAQRDTYSRQWRSERESILPTQNTSAPQEAKEAAWCAQAFEHGIEQLDNDPKGSFGIDPNAQNAKARLEKTRGALAQQRRWWRIRLEQLEPGNSDKALSDQKHRIRGILVLLDHSGLKPAEIAVVKSYFVKQETNFCAAKSKTLNNR